MSILNDESYTVFIPGAQGPRGASASIKIGAPFVIPATITPVTCILETATDLVDGDSQTGALVGIQGTLSRAGSVVSFTRKTNGAIANVPLGAAFIPFPDSDFNPLFIGDVELANSNDGALSVSAPLSVADSFELIPIPESSGYVHVEVDQNGKIAFAITSKGGVELQRIETSFDLSTIASFLIDQNASNGYLFDLRDSLDAIAFAVRSDGNTLLEKATIGDTQISRAVDKKYLFSLIDELKRICFAIRASGVVEVNTLETKIDLSFQSQSPIHFAAEYGQSNSTGSEGLPVIDTKQPYNNVMLSDTAGTFASNGQNLNFAPLVAPMRTLGPGATAWPQNIDGQNSGITYANEMSYLLGAGYITYLAACGQGGQGIDQMKKGGTNNGWAAMEFELKAAIAIAARMGRKVRHDGITLLLGENDFASATYLDKLIQMGYDAQDFAAIAQQPNPVYIFSWQQNTFATDGVTPSLSTKAELTANNGSPYHVTTGPRYQFYYPLGVHHDAHSFRRIGVKTAQVRHLVGLGVDWQPFKPKSITYNQTTGVLTVTCHVPYGPIRFDANCPPPSTINGAATTWANGRGFEVDGQTFAANAVQINGNVITIQCTVGAAITSLRYAMSATNASGQPYARGGRGFGRCGSICDSDPYRGLTAETLTCNVTNGSAVVTIANAGFKRRGWYDRVEGSGLPAFAIVQTRTSDTSLTLSTNWTGATGTAELTFWYDQSNYLLAFDLPVPYSE